jgi:hypothetical protein
MLQTIADYGETRESARRERAEKVGSLPGTNVQTDLQNLDSRVTTATGRAARHSFANRGRLDRHDPERQHQFRIPDMHFAYSC